MMFNDDTPETQDTPPTGMEDTGPIVPPREVAVGEKVKGKVVKVGEKTTFIDFGGRSEGSIETSQLLGEDGTPTCQVGDEIEAMVESVSDGVVFTLGKGKGQVDLSFLDEALASGFPIEGTIKAVNKGGVVVDLNGVRAFCPVAQIDVSYVSDPSTYVGRKMPFKILQWEKAKKNLVVSHRALLQEERQQRAIETRKNLEVGRDFDGVVRRLAPFGAFIDLGGVEGLAHISELSLSRITNPAEAVREGERVRVRVIKIEDLGGSKERVSLSLKALAGDPWAGVSASFSEGQAVEGSVVRLTDFGAFVELAPGIDGLIHVSELGHTPVAHPREAVKAGDRVTVKILRVDVEKKRISLSMKALIEGPAAAAPAAVNAQVGQVLDGTVASVKNFGVFVNLPSLGGRVSGLVPRTETGEPRNSDLARRFPAGTPVKVEIIQIDEKGRIRLSMAAAADRAQKADLEDYRRSQPARPAETTFGPLAELLRPLKEKMENGGES